MNNVCWCAEIAELVEVMLVEKRARSGWKLMEKFEESCLGLVENEKQKVSRESCGFETTFNDILKSFSAEVLVSCCFPFI
jgi:hypothetical protein